MVIFPLYHSGWDFEWWKGGGAGGGQNWDRRIEEGKPLFVEANFREEL